MKLNKNIGQQGMKSEQQLLINREWTYNDNYWSTGNEIRTAPIDQQGIVDNYWQGMKYWSTTKLKQQLLINREWISNNTLLINREWSYREWT